jgi:hypothetical protein
MFLSCWVWSEVESAAMWSIYTGRAGLGVAVETTFGQFERALPREGPHRILAGKVRYIDYRVESPPVGNACPRSCTSASALNTSGRSGRSSIRAIPRATGSG